MNRKKGRLLVRALILAVIIVITSFVIIALGKSKLDEYEKNVDELVTEIENNRQVVYVVMNNTTIEAGDIILAEGLDANVMRQEIYSGLEPEYYITEDDIGSIAIVDMEAGTPVMKNMIAVQEITHDTREYEVSVVDLMVDQQINDIVDIRIMFPNGEDYLILPKKQIKKLVLDSSIFYTYLNEEEILRLASATVDAYTMTGAKIYATRYVEGNLQNEAIPNYLVSAATMDLMASDPNIVTIAQETMNAKARMSLESRLSNLTEEQLAAVAEGHGIVDTAKNSILTSGGPQFAITEEEQAALDAEVAEEDGITGMTETTDEETTEDDVTGDENMSTSDSIIEGLTGTSSSVLY